jgi:hypothetical protein
MNEKIEWEQQLNIYAWLVEGVKGKIVDSVGIVAIIRDWSRREAAKNPDYPQAPVKDIPIKLWSYEDRQDFISSRISRHSECEFAMETDEDLPLCTPDEMWEKPTTWALKKKGGVRAIRVYETQERPRQPGSKGSRDRGSVGQPDPVRIFLPSQYLLPTMAGLPGEQRWKLGTSCC